MIEIKKILVPLDFSEPSKRALDCGLAFATRMNAKLVIAHIVPLIGLNLRVSDRQPCDRNQPAGKSR